MKAARPGAALFVALAAIAAGSVEAQGGQGAPAAASAKQQEHRGGQPAMAPAPPKKPPPRRRSVQQIISTVPPPQLAGPSYGPTLLYPGAPAPVTAPAPGAQPVYPPPPAALGVCQGSACTDASGAIYHGGVGNTLIDSQGRPCSRTGQTVQCF